jgi:hypothetical protein
VALAAALAPLIVGAAWIAWKLRRVPRSLDVRS